MAPKAHRSQIRGIASTWPRKIGHGAMIGSSGRSPIWDVRSVIKRSATCCVVTVYRRRRSANAGPEFIRIHLALFAGTDISAAEVLMRGLVTCYVLFLIYLESSRIDIWRITNRPNKPWKLRVTLEPVADFLVDAVERDTFRTRRRRIERDRAGHER